MLHASAISNLPLPAAGGQERDCEELGDAYRKPSLVKAAEWEEGVLNSQHCKK